MTMTQTTQKGYVPEVPEEILYDRGKQELYYFPLFLSEFYPPVV